MKKRVMSFFLSVTILFVTLSQITTATPSVAETPATPHDHTEHTEHTEGVELKVKTEYRTTQWLSPAHLRQAPCLVYCIIDKQ
jgi:hypothetical protein